MTYTPPLSDRASLPKVARIVAVARDFNADPLSDMKRLAYLRATLNHDLTAAVIVALADEAASPAERQGTDPGKPNPDESAA